MKALVEMKDMLKAENIKLKQDKNELLKYKNAWEELKNPKGLLFARFGPYPIKDKVIKVIEELEEKHGIGAK